MDLLAQSQPLGMREPMLQVPGAGTLTQPAGCYRFIATK
jgi:hypothetical protein